MSAFDPAMSNWRYVLDGFLKNEGWQHGVVLQALFETLLMAFLGTFFAAFFALPLRVLGGQELHALQRPLVFRFSNGVRGRSVS